MNEHPTAGAVPGVVRREGLWRAHEHEGYRPVALDVTGFWRPRLSECSTSHYDGRAGKALAAIVVGIVVVVGAWGSSGIGLPLVLVRADPTDVSVEAHQRALVEQAVEERRVRASRRK